MRPRAALWLALLLPGLAFSSGLDDPLPIRDPFPFKLLFLDQPPSAAALQPPLGARFSINSSYVNTMVATNDLVELYNRDPSYRGIVTLGVLQMMANAQPSRTAFIFDGETMRTTLQARVGIAQRFELGVDAPFLSQYRGFMDPLIDEFHQRFGLPDGGRTGFAHNQFRAGYIGDGVTEYSDEAPDGLRLGQGQLEDTLWSALLDTHCGCTMAGTAENCAAKYSVNRQEQDCYAIGKRYKKGAPVLCGR